MIGAIIGDRWRVADDHTAEDYAEDKLYETEGGSTVSVTPEGDIISVCKNQTDTGIRGADLLAKAVNEDGDRLDAFGKKLFGFYTKNGFEPISWTKFNREYAPHDWMPEYDEEPVVFYKYVGKGKTSGVSFSDFLERTKPCYDDDVESGYDKAKKMRNKSIKKK